MQNAMVIMNEAVQDLRKEANDKLVKVPLLEKKMNKWIKNFTESQTEGNNNTTEVHKKLHEIGVVQ